MSSEWRIAYGPRGLEPPHAARSYAACVQSHRGTGSHRKRGECGECGRHARVRVQFSGFGVQGGAGILPGYRERPADGAARPRVASTHVQSGKRSAERTLPGSELPEYAQDRAHRARKGPLDCYE